MKRFAALMLIFVLAASLLSGCSDSVATHEDAAGTSAFQPESTAIPSEETAAPTVSEEALPQVLDVLLNADVPEDAEPDITPVNEPDDAYAPDSDSSGSSAQDDIAETEADSADEISFVYEKLADTSFGFTFAYPIGWQNLPGKSTVCFRENDADGYATRVSVTAKNCFAHNPKTEVMLDEFQSFVETIHEQYDPETFELGTLNTQMTFMGKPGMSITYLAYAGEHEVYGYACCTGIGKKMYVFHFICAYEDSDALKPAMRRMRDSVTPVE